MLRSFYFGLAMVFATCFTFGGIGGVLYEAYQILNDIQDLNDNTGQYITWIVSAVGAIGYIVSAYLFVREDDKEDNDPDDEHAPTDIEDPSI